VIDHLDLCASQHKNSISELVNHLADLNESAAIDVSGVYWNDVDTPEDFRMVQRQLDFL
jgi:NDP-sugar pyrophosphorylase family protein